MGCCCSSDSVPDAPTEVKSDPGMSPVKVQVAAMGSFGGSRDFGIWENMRPSSGSDQKKTMWLWFNKSDLGPNKVRIDLENFKRGHVADQPDKGKVLFYCMMDEKPTFQYFQRTCGSARDSFFGFFNNSTYSDPEDMYYASHPQHVKNIRHGVTQLGHVITKWTTNAKVEFFDGDLGRGADILQKDPVVMEVFAKGTNVTTYIKWVTHNDGHHHTHYGKVTTELVDRIEYRLSFREMFWAEWFVEGDSFSNQAVDPTISSPLFDTTLAGGWFTRTLFTTQTKADVDPALALLISHACATEYSVAQVKKDMDIKVPERFPETTGYLSNGLIGLVLGLNNKPPAGTWAYQGVSRA